MNRNLTNSSTLRLVRSRCSWPSCHRQKASLPYEKLEDTLHEAKYQALVEFGLEAPFLMEKRGF